MSMETVLVNLKNAIENKCNSLIGSHDTDNNAHTNILKTVATTGDYNDLINKPNIPSAVTVDSSLSDSSTNPVENNIITNALNGKSNTNHNHDDRYYTESEINTKLDGKANSTHSHTWTSQSIGSFGTLRINTGIRLCILQYNREVSFPTANSTKTVASGAIPSSYRPSGTIIGSTYNPVVAMGINNSGDILMRASSATTSAVAVNCTTIWNY